MANGGLLGKEAHIQKVASAVTTSFTASSALTSTGALLADVLNSDNSSYMDNCIQN